MSASARAHENSLSGFERAVFVCCHVVLNCLLYASASTAARALALLGTDDNDNPTGTLRSPSTLLFEASKLRSNVSQGLEGQPAVFFRP